MTMEQTAEQQARDLLERMGVAEAQQMSAGDLVELANLIAELDHLAEQLRALEQWKVEGEAIMQQLEKVSGAFSFGTWWADRPWRTR